MLAVLLQEVGVAIGEIQNPVCRSALVAVGVSAADERRS
jgi:hypothetical protein